jgi:putative ABC transport system permease protein
VSPPLIRRAARAQWAALLTLGLLVLLTSFLVDAGPRTLVAGYDRGVRETLTGAPLGSTDLVVSAELQAVAPVEEKARGTLVSARAGGLTYLQRVWQAKFPEPLRDTIGTSEYAAATDNMPLVGTDERKLSLTLSSSVGSHIRYVSGRPPGAPEPGPRIEAGLPVRAAQRLHVKAGDVVTTTTQPALSVRITGLYTPADPGSAYWPAHHRFEDAGVDKRRDGEEIILGTALVSPDGYRALSSRTPFRIGFTWTYAPRAGDVTTRSAPALVDDVHRSGEALATGRVGASAPVLDSRLDDLLDDYLRRLHTTQTLLSLSLSGLFAAALGVLALATRLLLSRLGTALATQSARGASRAHLAGQTAALASLVTLPAAAAGLTLSALFVPGPAQTVSYIAAAALVVTAIALPAAVAGRRRRTTAASNRRLVAEGLVVVLAVAGTYMLRRRGLTTGTWSGGIDPFLSVVPALLSVAAGLLILRVLPYPLRLAGRVFARGRSAVPFVGVARASRQDATAVLPLVIILLAVAVIGFGSTVESSLTRAQRLATYESVGGDARADALSMRPAIVDRVRHSPGVREAVPAQTIDAARLLSQGDVIDELTVVGVDLDAYRRMMAGTGVPIPAWPKARPGEAAPAFFSRAASKYAANRDLGVSTDYGQRLAIRNAGTIASFPSQLSDAAFVLVPADALSRVTGGGNTGSVSIFVRGDHIDTEALHRNSALPELGVDGASSVVTYRMTHDAFTQGELGRLVGRGFGATGGLVAFYGTLAVLVLLFAGARARGRTVSYLRTLGLSRRQAQLLALVEIAPMLFAACVAGWVLGLVLPGLLGPAIDLRPYTGGFPVTHYSPDLSATLALAGGVLVFAGLAVLIDAASAARRGLGGVLRIGDT